MSRRTANGSQQFLAGEVPELITNLVTAPLTLTTQLQADGFIVADTSYIYKVDLKGMSQVKLTGIVKTVSASANSPKIQLRYSPTYTTTVASFVIMGKTSVEVSVFTGTTTVDSGWIDLVEGAKIDNCFLGIMSIGGNGAASPVINALAAHFR